MALPLQQTALFDSLNDIGFETQSIRWLLKSFPIAVLREWADITLAARERKGERFFRKSAQAWFVDNVKQAAAGNRTPPDWWHELHKVEQRGERKANSSYPERVIDPAYLTETPDVLQDFVRSQIATARRN